MTRSTDGADDDADDPQLDAMRAVWLALPDEEPPSRGIDTLMAAARIRAEALATPPWWRRVLQVMSRPPVLALATIMVLLGGAVLIGKRHDLSEAPAVKSRPPAPPTSGEAKAVGAEGTASDRARPTGTARGSATSPPAARDQANQAGGAVPRVARPVVPEPPNAPRGPAQIAPPTSTPTSTPTSRPGSGGANKTSSSAFEVEPTVKAKLDPADDTKANRDPRSDKETTVGGETATDEPPANTRAPTHAPAPKQALVDQLLSQCRSAATRGDCEAAKLIARRIAAQDSTYYKEHVAPDTTIQKCIGAVE